MHGREKEMMQPEFSPALFSIFCLNSILPSSLARSTKKLLQAEVEAHVSTQKTHRNDLEYYSKLTKGLEEDAERSKVALEQAEQTSHAWEEFCPRSGALFICHCSFSPHTHTLVAGR